MLGRDTGGIERRERKEGREREGRRGRGRGERGEGGEEGRRERGRGERENDVSAGGPDLRTEQTHCSLYSHVRSVFMFVYQHSCVHVGIVASL